MTSTGCNLYLRPIAHRVIVRLLEFSKRTNATVGEAEGVYSELRLFEDVTKQVVGKFDKTQEISEK